MIDIKIILIVILSYCHIVIIVTIVIIVIYSYCAFNISISYLPQNFFPFPLSLAIYRNFAAWWSAARRASNPYMHHPEMANIPVASPLPTNKNQAETAKCDCTPQRCAPMICFWIKKSKILCPLRYYPYICQQIKNSSMPRYINPFCDVGFKRIFGQEYSKPCSSASSTTCSKERRR